MLVHHLCDLFMDGLYGLVVAVRTEGLLDDGIEGFFLAFGGEGRHAAQDLVDEGFVELLSVLGIVEKAVKVGITVVESREEETQGRHIHDPVPDTLLNGVILGIVAESCLGELHRADAAEHILVDVSGGIVHIEAVVGFAGNVVGGVDEKDQIIFAEIIGGDHPIVKLGHKFLVFESAVTELQEKFLSAALQLLLKRKFHI